MSFRIVPWAVALPLCFACSADPEPAAFVPATGACTTAATADAPVGEAGPYHAGYRTFPLTYTLPGTEQPRTVTVNVWYPTQTEPAEGTRYLDFWRDRDVAVDAPPAAPLDGCGYPVLVYSHGHMGFAGTGAHLGRYFASHGWVTIAPDHTDNTLYDTDDPRPTRVYYARSFDLSRALDAVRDLPAGDPLHGRIAADRVVMAGHSFGTFTAWASAGAAFDVDALRADCPAPSGVCAEADLAVFEDGLGDDRIVAAVPMAGSYQRAWFGDGYASVAIPILQMTGGNDPVGAAEAWDWMRGIDLTWVEIADACHESFAMGVCDTLDVTEGFRIVDTYALAFARYHLLGDRDAAVAGIVAGTTSVSPLVTYRSLP